MPLRKRNDLRRGVAFTLSRALVVVVPITVGTSAARADQFRWTSAVNGSFGDPARWTLIPPGSTVPPPGIGDVAVFNASGSPYTVSFTANEATDEVQVTANTVSFLSSSATQRTYNVTTGTADVDVSGGTLLVGSGANPVALIVGDQLRVGSAAAGSVTVDGPSSLLGAARSVIGQGSFAAGLTIQNSAQAFLGSPAGSVNVGAAGVISINSGGVMTLLGATNLAATSSINFNDGSINLDNAVMTFNQSFVFGGTGAGQGPTFTVRNGADAVVTFAWIVGDAAGSKGTTAVTGVNGALRSTLRASGGGGGADIVVGNNGAGTFTVTGGGFVDSGDDLFVGRHTGAVGYMLVSGLSAGTRSFVDVSRTNNANNNIFVGGGESSTGGTGQLDVFDGALVDTSGDLVIGQNAGASGLVNVGTASATFSAEILVGDDLAVAGSPIAAGGDGTLNITAGGRVTVTDLTQVWANGRISVTDGLLNTNRMAIAGGSVTFDTFLPVSLPGGLTLDGGTFTSLSLPPAFGNGAPITIQNAGHLDVTSAGGQMNIDASNLFTLDGAGSLLEFSGFRFRVQGGSTMNVTNGADALIHTNFDVGNFGDGSVVVSGPGSSVITETSNEQMWWGRGTNSATVTFANGATGAFPGGVEVQNGASAGTSSLTVSGGASVTMGDMDIAALQSTGGAGVVNIAGLGSELSFNDGAYLHVGSLSGGTGLVSITDNGTLRASTGGTVINTTGMIQVAGGTFSLPNAASLVVNGPASSFAFTSGVVELRADETLAQPTLDKLLGGASVGANRTLRVLGQTTLPAGITLDLAGGALDAGSLVLLTGSSLTASAPSTISTGPLLALAGSIIDAGNSNLSLGSASAVNGFGSQGTMHVRTNTVTLLDANTSVFDSLALVTLGQTAGGAGTLAAANGITLDFGGNVTGFGTVNTPNDPFKPLINNGDITGNSPAEPVTLTGYVRGVGGLNNVVITGTNSPGFSPATVYYGSVGYGGTLEIELGGTDIGMFDRLIHSGTATLGGTLDIRLINGFTPAASESFTVITANPVVGTFQTITGREVNPTTWLATIYSPSELRLAVALPGDANLDGSVNLADFNILAGNFGASGVNWLMADFTGDGLVNLQDFNRLAANFGQTASPGGPTPQDWANLASAVPEPRAVASALLALATLGRRRTRGR